MKRSPYDQKLEQMLRSSKLVAGGFMGTDSRSPLEVIEADTARLEQMGVTAQQVAARMMDLTLRAQEAFGNWVELKEKFSVKAEEYKGSLICPWPHVGRYEKRLTTCRRLDTGEEIMWTDLNIHLIDAHGFFEGKGSSFRLEPEAVVRILFK